MECIKICNLTPLIVFLLAVQRGIQKSYGIPSWIGKLVGCATDVAVAGMTVIPGAGDFLVFFYGRAEQDNNSADLTVSLHHDGVQVPNTQHRAGVEQ